MMAMLRASYAEEADRIAQAARLLEAAGRECRAWRMEKEHGERPKDDGSEWDWSVKELTEARAAMDALAPELKEVGR